MRPDRLPFTATRVVKGVREELLSWGLKGTWLEHHALDHGPEGAFIGAMGLAARVGLSARTVEAHRDRLMRFGLLEKGNAPNGATAPWFPILPADCIPIEPRPTPEQLAVYVRRLEAHLDPTMDVGRSPEEPYDASAALPGSDRTVDPISIVRSVPSASYGREPTPSHPEGTVAAQTPCDTVPSASGGMEVVGVVGENLQPQAGGRARATNSNGQRQESEPRPFRELVQEEIRRARAAQRPAS